MTTKKRDSTKGKFSIGGREAGFDQREVFNRSAGSGMATNRRDSTNGKFSIGRREAGWLLTGEIQPTGSFQPVGGKRYGY